MEAYKFSIDSVKLEHSNLVRRKQRIKVGNSSISLQEVKSGIPARICSGALPVQFQIINSV